MDSIRRKPAQRLIPSQSSWPIQSHPPKSAPRQYREQNTSTHATPPFIPPKSVRKEYSVPSKHPRHPVRTIFLIIILFCILTFGYFSWKIGQATGRMNAFTNTKTTVFEQTIQGARSIVSPIVHTERKPLLGEQEGRTNILLLGKADDTSAGHLLTDTIMIASIDYNQKRIALLSLPRDLYVQIPGTHTFTKLNALYQYDLKNETGDNTIRESIETITGLPIHYFAALDYEGFRDVVNALGGINVFVERDLFDEHYPGPNYSYETFEIKKGWQKLDGDIALKYVRERHSDPEGDFGRAKRQQSVLQAMRDKAMSLKILLNPIAVSNSIDAISDHIRTNISPDDMGSFVALSRTFDTKNVTTAVVDAWKKDSLLRVSHVPVGNVAMFILVPRTGNWNEIQDLASNIFHLEEIQKRKEQIEKEEATVAVLNASGETSLESRALQLMQDSLGIKGIPANNTPKTTTQETRLLSCSDMRAPFTLDSLSKLFSTAIAENQSSYKDDLPKCDIALILGEESIKQLSFKEDNIENFEATTGDTDYQKALNDALTP